MTKKNLFPCFNMLKTKQKTIAISINPILAFFNSTYYPITGPWVTRPERPKGVKDEVKRPEGPPARSRGPEGP